MRALYSVALWLAQPLLMRKLRRRGVQEPGYLLAMDERFGRYASTAAVLPHAGPTVWIHAVSLGETRAAAVLVAALRAQLPGMRLLLTHGTATGRAEGTRLLQPGDLQAWQPWDTPGATQRFLAHFQPQIGVLMETEIWPNLVHACQTRGVPLVLANARLSEKSLRQTQRLAWLARPAYAALAAVWAQTPADAQRLAQLGAPVRGVLGNLKFDATPDRAQIATGRAWRARTGRPVLMLASSREGEELALLQLLKAGGPASNATGPTPSRMSGPGPVGAQPSGRMPFAVQTAIAQGAGLLQRQSAGDLPVVNGGAGVGADAGSVAVQWLIVPRHPQRFQAVVELIQAHGFTVSRRSTWGDAGPPPPSASAPSPTVWLGDSLGEMALYFGLADVALLGGSFAPLGGQNLIEAAACGCPVVMGPHTFNFAEAAEQALAAGAAQRVPDLAQAISAAAALAGHPAQLAQARQASDDFALAHRGAAHQLAQAIVQVLKDGPCSS